MQKPTGQKAHLRSIKEVVGYTLVTSDGKKGRLEDFMIEMHNGPWLIRWGSPQNTNGGQEKSLAGDRKNFKGGLRKSNSAS